MAKGVLLFPKDVQICGPKKQPRIGKPHRAKLRSRAALYWRVFWEGFASPIFNSQAVFQFIATMLGLFVLFALVGRKMMPDTATTTVAAAIAFAAAMAVWALIQAIAMPFRARAAEATEGRWVSGRFVYNDARRVFTTEWNPSKNGHHETFVVPSDIQQYAVVDYKIEIDGPADRLRCLIIGSYYFSPMHDVLSLWEPAMHGRVVLKKGRKLDLYCLSQPDTIRAIVRVSILAWEIDQNLGMEYTDQRTQTRIVMQPPWAERQ